MRILLTGARGQLGRAVQAQLISHEILATDLDELDITRLGAVRGALDARRPDLVINAAAYTNVDLAEEDVGSAYRINALGPRNLAIASGASDVPLLHVSTDYVFDGTLQRPYHEFDRPHPLSVYGASKLAGEEAVRQHNPHHYIVRTSWLYHVHGRNFPNTMRELAQRGEVRVVNDQFGSPTYAPHLAAAIGKLLETRAWGTYHLAGHGGTSWFELTRTLYSLLALSASVTPVSTAAFPRPAPRPKHAVLTTLQDPAITLPPWPEGLAAYVGDLATSAPFTKTGHVEGPGKTR